MIIEQIATQCHFDTARKGKNKLKGIKKIENLDLCPTDHTYQEKVFCFGATLSHI